MPTPLINLQEVATPGGSPSSGYGYIWVDSSDSRPYFKSDGGTTLPMFVNWSAIAATMRPDVHNSRDLGENGTRWKTLFLSGGAQVQGTFNVQTITVEGNATLGDGSGDSQTINGTLTKTHYPSMFATHAANATLPVDGTLAKVALTGVHGHSGLLSGDTITIPAGAGGTYRIMAKFAGYAAGRSSPVPAGYIKVNAATAAVANTFATGTVDFAFDFIAIWEGALAAGDTLDFWAQVGGSGGSLQLYGHSSIRYTCFSLERIK